jgi:hypothetical protein
MSSTSLARPSSALTRARSYLITLSFWHDLASRALDHVRRLCGRAGLTRRSDLAPTETLHDEEFERLRIREPFLDVEHKAMSITADREVLRTDFVPAKLSELLEGDNALAPELHEFIREVPGEFRKELLDLLNWFTSEELRRFVDLCALLEHRKRIAFVAFVTAGGVPDGEFLAYLNRDKACQEAVDLAFVAHIRSLGDFSQALSKAAEVEGESSASRDSGDGYEDTAIVAPRLPVM